MATRGLSGRIRYYQVIFDYNATLASFVARAAGGLDHSQLIDGRFVGAWTPASFALPEGRPVDYQQNDLGWRLCSRRMRQIIDQGKSSEDSVSWFDAKVVTQDGAVHPYHILHFPHPLSLGILDRHRTVFNPSDPRLVVKPALRPEALVAHRVFTYEGGFNPWFVSEDIRDALQEAKCELMEFAER